MFIYLCIYVLTTVQCMIQNQFDDSVQSDDSVQFASASCADECPALPRCTVLRFNELS